MKGQISLEAIFGFIVVLLLFSIILIFVFLYGFFIFYISFTHHLNRDWVIRLAGPTLVYFLSIVSVLWGYDLLAVNSWVIFDLIVIFLFIYVIFY